MKKSKWSDEQLFLLHFPWWLIGWAFVISYGVRPIDFLRVFPMLPLFSSDISTIVFFALWSAFFIIGPFMEKIYYKYFHYNMTSLTGLVIISFFSSMATAFVSSRFVIAYLTTPFVPLFLEGLTPLLNDKTKLELRSKFGKSLISISLVDISVVSIILLSLTLLGN